MPHQLTNLEGGQESTNQTESLRDLDLKRQTLLELEFEAAIHSHIHDHDSTTPISLDSLCDIISQAQQLSAPPKTYALFADIVLSSACIKESEDATTDQPSPSSAPFLPLPTAATLLTHLITALRNLPDYDTIRASRWIRCLVHLCLNCHRLQQQQLKSSTEHGSQRAASSGDQEPALQTIEDIITQAIILARQSHHQQSKNQQRRHRSSPAPPPPYPPEELECLSTTLFNLGIDFYVYANNNIYNQGNNNNENGTAANAEAKKWTHLAVEVADVLAENPVGIEGGGRMPSQGLLSRVLRGKMKEGLGWVI